MTPETPVTSKTLRRTQAERSEAMRVRLIEATLKCLETDGYVGTKKNRNGLLHACTKSAPGRVHAFASCLAHGPSQALRMRSENSCWKPACAPLGNDRGT